MKVAFDSRPAPDPRGIGRYVSCLLDALRETAGEHELVESHRPRRVDAFHSPWIDGALLRPPCPQVVTLHDVVPLKRRSEYLRSGIRFRMRYLAVERSKLVIVPSAVVAAEVTEHLGIGADRLIVVPEAPGARSCASAGRRRSPRSASATACRRTTCCGSAGCRRPTRASASRRSPRRRASCRSCSWARRSRGRTSCPT